MNEKTILRKAKNKENPYAQISRSAVQDKKLSWKATGLLAYLLSLPDDWQVYLSDLAKRKASGTSATSSAYKELCEAGYIQKVSTRNEKGHFVKHEHFVHEAPLSTNQKPENGILDTTNKTIYLDDKRPGPIEEQKFKQGQRGNFDDTQALKQ